MNAQPGTDHGVDGQLDALLTAMADGVSTSPRSPVWHTPAERGLEFEDVSFPSEDGTPLEGWLVPPDGADTSSPTTCGTPASAAPPTAG